MGPNANTTYTPDRDSLFAVAKLSADGSNWVTFKTQFIYAMAGHDIEGHFDRSEPCPTPPTFSTMDQNKWTPEDEAKHESHLKFIRTWKRNENIAHVQLAQAISDSLLFRIQHASNVANMWATIVMEHDRKGHMMQVDLHRRMMEKQAKETDDIWAHLDYIVLMYE